MRQTSIGFKSNGLNLEGIVSVPDDSPGPFPTVVICHSHPALSGNMGNKIVTAISDSALEHGIASLRFNFRGVGESTHGQHNRLRAPGSIGAGSTPSRVFKGMKMAGQYGNKKVSTRNLEIVSINKDTNQLLIKGAIPGPNNGIIFISK